MTVHPRVKFKGVENKEYRPLSGNYPYPEEVQKTKEWLERVLENNQILKKRDRFRLIQFLLAAQRQLSNNEDERNNLLLELVRRGNEGLQLGFSLAEISAANRLAIELKMAGSLNEDFLQKVKTRIGAK
jgi:hypothetical protein